MKTENVDLMKMARLSLKGKWGLAVGTFLLYYLIIGVFQAPASFSPMSGLQNFILIPVSGFLTLIIAGPMALGIAVFSLSLARDEEDVRFEMIFKGFSNFGTSLGAYLLMVLFVFLWTLLLIIPGIIAALSYSMTFFIIADDNTIGCMEAIDKSKAIMKGHKAKLFRMFLRFLGLALLCLLTLGIGFLWLIPFIQVTMAKFYDDVK